MASDLLRFALKAKDNNRLGLGENSQSRVGGSMIINVTVDAEPSPSSSNTNIQTSNVLNRLNPTMNRLGGSTARLQASNAKLNGSSLNLAENRQGYKTSTLTINGAFLAEQSRQSMSLHPEFGHRSLLTKSFRNIASAQGRPKKIKHRTSLAVDKELDSNTIFSIAGESEFGKVTNLDISGKAFTSVLDSDFHAFKSLVCINANENYLYVEDFARFENIRSLSLACNLIKEVVQVNSRFLHLETLDLSFNRIRNAALGVLATLPSLRCLNLMNNEITSVGKEILTQAHWNQDGEIKNIIEAFPKLEILDLEGNRIMSINPESLVTLSQLPRLKKLILNKNQIHSFAIFKQLAGGESDRKNNDLASSIKSYKGFLKLEELHIADNLIGRQNDLLGVVTFPKLKAIWLLNNPLFKNLVMENRYGEFSELLSAFEDIYHIRIEDIKHVSGKERNFVSKLASIRKKNGMPPKLKKIEEPVLKPAPKLNEEEIIRLILEQNKESSLSSLSLPSIKDEFAQAEDSVESLSTLEQKLLPMEKSLWEFSGVQLSTKEKERAEKEKLSQAANRYLPQANCTTFLTGLHIENSTTLEHQIRTAKSHYSSEKWSTFLQRSPANFVEVQLPSTIQGTVKALRFTVKNPQYYWRMAERRVDPHGLAQKNGSKDKTNPTMYINRNKRDFWELYNLMDELERKTQKLDDTLKLISTESAMNRHKSMAKVTITQAKDLQALLFAAASKPTK